MRPRALLAQKVCELATHSDHLLRRAALTIPVWPRPTDCFLRTPGTGREGRGITDHPSSTVPLIRIWPFHNGLSRDHALNGRCRQQSILGGDEEAIAIHQQASDTAREISAPAATIRPNLNHGLPPQAAHLCRCTEQQRYEQEAWRVCAPADGNSLETFHVG